MSVAVYGHSVSKRLLIVPIVASIVPVATSDTVLSGRPPAQGRSYVKQS